MIYASRNYVNTWFSLEYLNKGYVFCADTNFFMEEGETLIKLRHLSNETILISDTAFKEMDHMKDLKKNDDPSELDEVAKKCRKGLEVMDTVHATIIPSVNNDYLKNKDLGFSNDERIVGSYLKYQEENPDKKLIFLSLDRGARTIARSYGLIVPEYDITEYNRLKNLNQKATIRPVQTQKNIYKTKNKRKRVGGLGLFYNVLVSIFQSIALLVRSVFY